ncbi:MORN repeat variant [Pseudoxanthomonas sp. CF385]|uniref:toxin-antitoxin system YwqK family antitoxin n=1 Tax=Pseudoxanthomonas sp. CF385 TaxID=1881042 RepID=UPI00088E2E60|nr:hypothetical protein [Pseudoxanthomonas sp. CF385]SDR15807.1 MORN repeat variant [Pseudoxanthomonas sp. CF385]
MDNPPIVNFFPTGEKESECETLSGVPHGIQRRFFKNGQIFFECFYLHGVLNGLLREWDESGQLKVSASTINGQYDGAYQSWWPDGQIKEQGVFRADQRVPGYTWFRSDGSVWRVLGDGTGPQA